MPRLRSRRPAARTLAALGAVAALALPMPSHAQPTRDRLADSVRREIEAAVPSSDRERIAAARAIAERGLSMYEDDPLLQHYQAYALWREAGILLGMNEPAQARPLLEQADALLERSAERQPMAETYALRASVTGQLIGTSRNPLTGMRLGPRSSSLMERAENAGPRNPRVWLLKGMNAVYTPGVFGGGLDRARAHLQRAIELFADDRPAPPLPAWGLADAHVWLGQVHAKQGRTADARAAYQRALALQPDNVWVRQSLLPALDRAASR